METNTEQIKKALIKNGMSAQELKSAMSQYLMDIDAIPPVYRDFLNKMIDEHTGDFNEHVCDLLSRYIDEDTLIDDGYLMPKCTICHGIDWDADGEVVEDLPHTYTFAGYVCASEVADELSDIFGYCVFSTAVKYIY